MSKELPPSRTAEQFVVRFPDGMRDRIAEAAKANNRSMNAEIVARIESSFSDAAPTAGTLSEEAEQLRNELISIIERKRKNEETLSQLKMEGFQVHEIALAFEREWQLMGPKALQIAQRMGQLGQADTVREITRYPGTASSVSKPK